MAKRGRKRSICHEDVVAYARSHPEMLQSEIGAYFGITQSRVSHILLDAGVKGMYKGRPLEPKPHQTEEEAYWERVLHNLGLGMNRGLRRDKILYGYDPRQGKPGEESATNATF